MCKKKRRFNVKERTQARLSKRGMIWSSHWLKEKKGGKRESEKKNEGEKWNKFKEWETQKSKRARKTVWMKESEKVKRPQKSRMRKKLIKKKQESHKGIVACTNRETEKRSINKGTKIRID